MRKCMTLVVILLAAVISIIQAEENIGTKSQPLVGGPTVDQQTRRELGLLTLLAQGPAPAAPGMLFPGKPGTKQCSAALLNDYWAITASHCIDAVTEPNQITLRADWSSHQTRQASYVHSFQWTHNLDIALVMIENPFPRHHSVTYPQLSYRSTSDLMGQRIELYGCGISTLAWQAGSTPMPAQSDGQFRSNEFEVFETSPGAFKYRSIEGAGGAIAGGDSGGPSYFRVWDDPNSPNRQIVRLLAGVHSLCQTKCLEGQTCGSNSWTWVANIPECADASVEPILHEIQTFIVEVPKRQIDTKPDLDLSELSKVPRGILTKPDVPPGDLTVVPDRGIVTKPEEVGKQAAKKEEKQEDVPSQKKASDIFKTFGTPRVFTGVWGTVTGTNAYYTMTLTQNGNTVSGSYTSPDGTITGVITGFVSDRTLVYRWEGGGGKGTGKFILSEYGAQFDGWWNSSDNPDMVEGTWKGTRK